MEQVAFASDAQVGSVGMIAGMSPLAFRERAKIFLDTAENNSEAVKRDEERKSLLAQLEAEKKARIDQEEFHKLEMAELRELIQAATKRGPGRPPKDD